MGDSVEKSVSGMKAVVEAAKLDKQDHALQDSMSRLETCPIAPGDQVVKEIYKEMAKPKPKAKAKPTPKAGKSKPSTPEPEPFKKMAKSFQVDGYLPEETRAAALLRKRLYRWFDRFEHRLRPYFETAPPIESMTIQQMTDTETLVKSVLDETDEAIFVEKAFIYGASVIERVGPSFYQRFGRFVPGSEILRHQRGLAAAVEKLVHVPGPSGLKEEIDRVAIEFTGWAPQNPYINGALKLWNVMQQVHEMKLQQIENSMASSAVVKDQGY